MASQTPFILVDNVFDRINLYPLGILSSSAAVVGREVNYIADYRRERTLYQAAAAAANQFVRVDLTTPNARLCDSVWIDRGHNLWGQQIFIEGSNDGVSWAAGTQVSFTAPAQGTVGGDPTGANGSVTEEGALYFFFAGAAWRYWQVRVVGAIAPLITGVILGTRNQLLNYSSVLDEDAGDRVERQENSLVQGYYGRDRVYTGRKLTLQLATIGIADYDNNIRALRRFLFEKDQPAFIVTNYGIRPERGWLYQYSGQQFSAPTERVYRRASFSMVEVGPLVR